MISTYLGYLFAYNFLSSSVFTSLNRMLVLMSKNQIWWCLPPGLVTEQVGMDKEQRMRKFEKIYTPALSEWVFPFHHILAIIYIFIKNDG